VAIQSGGHAAAEIVRRSKASRRRGPSCFRDRGSRAAVSRYDAIGERGAVRVSGFAGWLFWLAVHLAFLTGTARAHDHPQQIFTRGVRPPPRSPEPKRRCLTEAAVTRADDDEIESVLSPASPTDSAWTARRRGSSSAAWPSVEPMWMC
jgi:hypothetical protein